MQIYIFELMRLTRIVIFQDGKFIIFDSIELVDLLYGFLDANDLIPDHSLNVLVLLEL
jgi:hypothetical protein